MDWEPLRTEWTAKLDAENPLGSDFKTVQMVRDESWQIAVTARGEDSGDLREPQRPELRAGEEVPSLPELKASKNGGAVSVTLERAHWFDYKGTQGGEVSLRIAPQYARIRFASSEVRNASCFLWCLNGPSEVGFYFRRTKRERLVRYSRERLDEPDRIRELRGGATSLDYLYLPAAPLGDGATVLAQVPDGVTQKRVRPTALEFRLSDPTSIPTWPVLDSYLSALSFAIGRRIIPVGLSVFDDGIHPREHALRNAWSMDLDADLRRPSSPPAPLAAGVLDPAQEVSLKTLIDGFRTADEIAALSDAMWMLWFSEAVPLEAALPNLASALECIMNAWFKSTKTPSGGKYMDDAAWSSVSTGPRICLETALKDHAQAQRILSRVRNANSFGVNERFERFLEEIALPIGKVEKEAFRSRNKAAHGGTYDPTMYKALGNRVRAYRTLVHRVILALIGWNGEYVDYSSYGFPARPLKSPLGGPEGNGEPD